MNSRAVTSEQLLRDIEALSEDDRRQVADFVAFLRSRAKREVRKRAPKLVPLAEDPAIGMWRDREDMKDGVAWVRSIREREWNRRWRRQHAD